MDNLDTTLSGAKGPPPENQSLMRTRRLARGLCSESRSP